MQSAWTVLHCHQWRVWLYHIFPHDLTNGTIFGKKLLNIKCVLILSTYLSETFLILRRIERDVIVHVHRSVCKLPAAVLIRFHETRICSTDFRSMIKYQVS
jgi:hypothetical protein